jgi:hypothetical protein
MTSGKALFVHYGESVERFPILNVQAKSRIMTSSIYISAVKS